MTEPQLLAVHTYNHYGITVRAHNVVTVYDPRWPHDRTLYKTTSLDKAMRWIDAYRDGQIWATEAALTA